MLIVQKYGGTSLGDEHRLKAAAERIAALHRQGHRLVIVVSAQADLTDRLLEQAETVKGSAREMDAFLSVGEQMSAALMAMSLTALGCSAVSLTGWQAGIHTDDVFGNARIRSIDTRRILTELDQGRVTVVSGFQGVDPRGNITTLGRGGSDTTAVALAAALHADRCQIFTDVDGVYDRDPRSCPDAVRYDRIGYEQMLTLARSGAQVLHDRCIVMARDHKIPIEVLSAFADAPGTVVAD